MLVASENHPVCALGLLIYEVTRLLWGSTSKEGPVHNKSRAGVCRPHTQSLFQAVGSLLECSLNTWLSSHRNRTRSIPHRNRKSSETVESPHLLEIEQHFHLNDVKTIFLRLQDDICHTWSFSSQSPVQSIHYVRDPTFLSKYEKTTSQPFARAALGMWVSDLSDSCGGAHSRPGLQAAHV